MDNLNITIDERSDIQASDTILTDDYLTDEEKAKLTDAQKAAIRARGRSILVSAAAGSGKTFTLTKRIIKSIINDENKTLGRMLIVTFTRSAAADLKKKISEALSSAIAENPHNKHLQDEMLKLGSAQICTIDSFFSAPVKANFEKLNLPASWRMADEAELIPIRRAVMSATLGEFYSTKSGIEQGKLIAVGSRTAYTDLLTLLANDPRKISKVIDDLLEYYGMTQTVPGGIEIIRESAYRLREYAEHDFFDTDAGKNDRVRENEGEILKNSLKNTLNNTIKGLDSLADRVIKKANEEVDFAREKGVDVPSYIQAILDEIVPFIYNDRNVCIELSAKLYGDYETAYLAAHNVQFDKFPNLKANISDFSKSVNEELNGIIQPIKDLGKKVLPFTKEQIKEQLISSADAGELIYEILSTYDMSYVKEKRLRGVCEFSDMPKFLLYLLRDSEGKRTPLAEAMRSQYDEVYIDEYQDVNAIQDEIFRIIGEGHRFMVGDIKQSIYCFRDAEPELLRGYKDAFDEYNENTVADSSAEAEEKICENGYSIFMSENFRCDRGIIDFSNEVCNKIFMAFAKSIGYDETKDKLIFGKKDNFFSPPQKVSITLIEPESSYDEAENEEGTATSPKKSIKNEKESDEEKFAEEATVTANEIARLIRDPNVKNANGSKLKAGNIAVLVRKNKLIPIIANALSNVGIKYVTNAKNALLESDEVKLLVDILTVIDNPRDDVPLSRVMTATLPSYVPPFTFEEVIQISEASKNLSLYDAVDTFSDEGNPQLKIKCKDFVTVLRNLRKLSIRVSAEKLLRAVAACDRFSLLCENEGFTYLYNVAGNYSRTSWNGLYTFINYFRSLMEKGDGNSDPVMAAEDEVTIITMHQSKGLEYNVCFLFGLGKWFNKNKINTTKVFFDRERGISMKLAAKAEEDGDIISRTRIKETDNVLFTLSRKRALEKLAEEEARLLYVALTRAKERLYLSATISTPYEKLKAKYVDKEDLSNDIRGANSYFDWILMTLHGFEDKNGLFEITKYQKNSTPQLADKITPEELEELEKVLILEKQKNEEERKAKLMSEGYSLDEYNKAKEIEKAEIAAEKERKSNLEKAFIETIRTPIQKNEQDMGISLIPAKLAASKASSRLLDESLFTPTPFEELFSENNDQNNNDTLPENVKRILNRINLMQSQSDSFDNYLSEKATAADKGSAMHRVLQFCKYQEVKKNGIEAELERLEADRFISKKTLDLVNKKQLEGFFDSELFEKACKAPEDKLWREFQFGLFRPAAEFTENEELKKSLADRKIFVQGSIDLLFESDEGLILCDYKTDRPLPCEQANNYAAFKERMLKDHADQLKEYRYAIRAIFGKEPAVIYIFSIALGEVIRII